MENGLGSGRETYSTVQTVRLERILSTVENKLRSLPDLEYPVQTQRFHRLLGKVKDTAENRTNKYIH